MVIYVLESLAVFSPHFQPTGSFGITVLFSALWTVASSKPTDDVKLKRSFLALLKGNTQSIYE